MPMVPLAFVFISTFFTSQTKKNTYLRLSLSDQLQDLDPGENLDHAVTKTPWNTTCLSGWWLTYPSEKYEFVSWDHYSQYMESHKTHVPNHQPVIDIFCGLRSSVPSDFPCPKTLKARPGMRRQLPNTFTSDRNPRSSQVLPCFRKSGGFDVGITGKHGTFHS